MGFATFDVLRKQQAKEAEKKSEQENKTNESDKGQVKQTRKRKAVKDGN